MYAEGQYDSQYRLLAVVYVNGTKLNEKMVRVGYAEVMYIPPSEFDCWEWDIISEYIGTSHDLGH